MTQHNPSDERAELTDAQLDEVTGGGTNSKGKGSDLPRESLSLNFTKIEFSYTN
jgi:type VI protein secretion system component Hcp